MKIGTTRMPAIGRIVALASALASGLGGAPAMAQAIKPSGGDPTPGVKPSGRAPEPGVMPTPGVKPPPASGTASGKLGRDREDGEPADPARAIRAVLDKQEADWNRGDLDAFLEGYWHSPGVVFLSGGDRNVGFDAMRDRYRKRYQAEGRAMGQLAFSDLVIEPLGAEVAMASGRWQLALPDGKKPGGLYTLILRKLPEGWKITHDHTSSGDPQPSTPAPAAAPAPKPAAAPGGAATAPTPLRPD